MSFPKDKILLLTGSRDSCEERLQIHFLKHFILFLSLLSLLPKVSFREISEIKYVWSHLPRITRKTLAIMSFGLECSA